MAAIIPVTNEEPASSAPAQRTIRGNLAATPVANMLHTVHERKLTGRGTFQRNNDRIELTFRDGQVVHAASNDPDQRLGEILLREAMITLQHYNDSVQVLLETGRRQGEVLVENGWLNQHDLKRAVRIQMKEIIYWLMQWETGDYIYRWTEPHDEAILLTTTMHELILRGMRRCERFSRLREVLAPWNRRVALNTEIDIEVARSIRLKEDESAVLGLVDGQRTLAQIVDFAPLPDMQTMQILYGLKWARIVSFLTTFDEHDDTLP